MNWKNITQIYRKLDKNTKLLSKYEFKNNNDSRQGVVLSFLNLALKELYDINILQKKLMLRPAGNAIRCYCEAVGMAFLCSSKKLAIFDQLKQNIKNSEGGIAIQRLSDINIRKKLPIDEDSLLSLIEIANFSNQYSHASYVNILYQISENKMYPFTIFKKDGIEDYKKLFEVYLSLLDNFESVIDMCDLLLNE